MICHFFFDIVYMLYLLSILVELRIIWHKLCLKVVKVLRLVHDVKELCNFKRFFVHISEILDELV